MRKLCLAACLFAVLTLPQMVRAQSVTLTFDEAPGGAAIPIPVTNPAAAGGTSPFLSFNGVTFDFRVGGLLSADARYGALGPGNFTFLDGRVLEGDAGGILTLGFAAPTSFLSFGIGLSSLSSLAPAARVTLFDAASQLLGDFSINTQNLVGVSEAQFRYEGALVSQAVIDFNEAALPPVPRRFALDNLAFQPIPEPTSLALVGMGLAGTVVFTRKRRKALSGSAGGRQG